MYLNNYKPLGYPTITGYTTSGYYGWSTNTTASAYNVPPVVYLSINTEEYPSRLVRFHSAHGQISLYYPGLIDTSVLFKKDAWENFSYEIKFSGNIT